MSFSSPGCDRRPGFPFSFRCQRSGNCCARPGGTVHVDDDDVRRLAAHLGQTEATFRSLYVHSRGDRLIDGQGPACVFLAAGREAACTVYEARPSQCRTWPFWPELRDDPAALREAARFCPGIVVDP